MTESVWQIARDYSKQLANKSTKKTSQRFYSIFTLLFNDKRLTEAFEETKNDPDGPTLMDIRLNKQVREVEEGKSNYSAMVISNTGLLSNVDSRIIGMSWKQGEMVSNAFSIYIGGGKAEEGKENRSDRINDGLGLTVCFQQGIFVNIEHEQAFVRYLRVLLEALISGKWSKNINVGELFQLMDSEIVGFR